jgi:hypothetical protein
VDHSELTLPEVSEQGLRRRYRELVGRRPLSEDEGLIVTQIAWVLEARSLIRDAVNDGSVDPESAEWLPQEFDRQLQELRASLSDETRAHVEQGERLTESESWRKLQPAILKMAEAIRTGWDSREKRMYELDRIRKRLDREVNRDWRASASDHHQARGAFPRRRSTRSRRRNVRTTASAARAPGRERDDPDPPGPDLAEHLARLIRVDRDHPVAIGLLANIRAALCGERGVS